MTPYRNAIENSSESFFNDQHSKGRSIVERTFGVLKARFRCLLAARELHYSPEKAVQILNVCCSLHNICLMFNVESDSFQTEEEITASSSLSTNTENSLETNLLQVAKNIRNEIKNNIFRN